MAFSGAKVAERTIKRFGQVATLNWPSKALDAVATNTTAQTYVYLESKGTQLPASSSGSMVGMHVERSVTAMMPLQDRDVTGASLSVGSLKYVIASATIESGSYILAVLQ